MTPPFVSYTNKSADAPTSIRATEHATHMHQAPVLIGVSTRTAPQRIALHVCFCCYLGKYHPEFEFELSPPTSHLRAAYAPSQGGRTWKRRAPYRAPYRAPCRAPYEHRTGRTARRWAPPLLTSIPLSRCGVKHKTHNTGAWSDQQPAATSDPIKPIFNAVKHTNLALSW